MVYIMAITSITSFAIEISEDMMTIPIYTRTQYINLFSEAGYTIPENAILGITSAEAMDGEVYDIAVMTVVNNTDVTKNFLVEMAKNTNGNESILSIHESMSYLKNGESFDTNASKTLSRYNVTVTVNFNQKTDSDGKLNYQPKSLSLVSYSTQQVEVYYQITGWKYNQTEWGMHTISNVQTPAYAQQYYSTINIAPLYYRPLAYAHVCQIVAGNNSITLNVTEQ